MFARLELEEEVVCLGEDSEAVSNINNFFFQIVSAIGGEVWRAKGEEPGKEEGEAGGKKENEKIHIEPEESVLKPDAPTSDTAPEATQNIDIESLPETETSESHPNYETTPTSDPLSSQSSSPRIVRKK